MKAKNLLLGLAPWVLFSAVAQILGADAVAYGAGLAFLGSLALAVRGARSKGPTVIEAAGVATFGVLTLVAFLGSHAVRQDIVDYGRGGSALVLALVMLVSAFTLPFTEQYARPMVDRRYWGSPVFRAANRRMSLLWSGLIAAMATSHLVAGALAASGHERPILNLALNWGVPVLVVLRGVAATERIAARPSTPVAGGVA